MNTIVSLIYLLFLPSTYKRDIWTLCARVGNIFRCYEQQLIAWNHRKAAHFKTYKLQGKRIFLNKIRFFFNYTSGVCVIIRFSNRVIGHKSKIMLTLTFEITQTNNNNNTNNSKVPTNKDVLVRELNDNNNSGDNKNRKKKTKTIEFASKNKRRACKTTVWTSVRKTNSTFTRTFGNRRRVSVVWMYRKY